MNSEVDLYLGGGLLEDDRYIDVDGGVPSNNRGIRGGELGDIIDEVSSIERDAMMDGGGGGVDGDDCGNGEDNDGYSISSSLSLSSLSLS